MGIHFRKVDFTYSTIKRKKKPAFVLEDINLDIAPKAEFVAIVGHTGSGKSTLIQMMNGLLVPSYGTVNVFSSLIDAKHTTNLKSVRKKVGLVFQFPEYQLFEETVLKDIAFGPKNFGMSVDEANNKARESSKLVNLEEDILQKNPFSLSGGQMRKVAIAGILASEPDVLIFDEPTVGLDPQAKRELLDMLTELNTKEDKTIIIVTHDMDVVSEAASRVVVLDDGKIVYDGAKEQLFKDQDFLTQHSLLTPIYINILKHLKDKTGLPIDIYQYNLTDTYREIERVIKDER